MTTKGSRAARAISGAGLAVALVALIGAFAAAGEARAGELAWKGCMSADGVAHPHGRKACTAVGPAASRAFASLNALGLSPDGRSLYSASGIECLGLDDYRCYAYAAVGQFDRNSKTGKLDYRDCLTGDEPPDGCTGIPGAAPDALETGLGDIASIAVSPDGRSLYAVSPGMECASNDFGTQCYGGNALARFDRDANTGDLTYRGCFTGDRRSGPSGSGACTEIPSATADGDDSGFENPQSLALSDDGRSLYVGAAGDSAIARFDRDAETGALTYRGCVTGSEQLGPSGSGACAETPSATANGGGSGLGGVTFSPGKYPVIVSPDGRSVYVGATGDGDIARLDRDPATGSLTYAGCTTGRDQGRAACTEIPQRVPTQSLAVSPDARFVYAGGSRPLQFRRNAETGALGHVRTIAPGGDLIAVGANGSSLYLAMSGSETVRRFRVDSRTGSLRYKGCIAGGKIVRRAGRDHPTHCALIPSATPYGHYSGLHKINSLVARGRTLYASTEADRDIATFGVAPQTRIRKAKTRGHHAVFRFRASARSEFRCKLKGKQVKRKLRRWRRCGSHRFRRKGRETYRHLRPGRKVFKVRATNRDQTTDPTPAKRRWRVR